MATVRLVELDGVVYADTKKLAALMRSLTANPKYKEHPEAILEVVTEWLETAQLEKPKSRWLW